MKTWLWLSLINPGKQIIAIPCIDQICHPYSWFISQIEVSSEYILGVLRVLSEKNLWMNRHWMPGSLTLNTKSMESGFCLCDQPGRQMEGLRTPPTWLKGHMFQSMFDNISSMMILFAKKCQIWGPIKTTSSAGSFNVSEKYSSLVTQSGYNSNENNPVIAFSRGQRLSHSEWTTLVAL